MKIYQAYMDPQQKDFVCKGAIPFDAAANSAPGTREYELFRKIHTDPALGSDNEPWGLISWKFEHKAPISFQRFNDFCQSVFANDADCAFINPMIGNEAVYANVWEQGIHCAHIGIEKVAYYLEEQMGIHMTAVSDVNTFSFCNYFVANHRFREQYFEFVDQALSLLDAESAKGSEVGQIYSGNGQYARDDSASMRVFVIERLFSSFLLKQDSLKVQAFRPSAKDYDSKFGVRMGQLLRNFSRVKQRAVETDDLALYNIWDKQRSSLLADGHIQTIWNMDDPYAYPLTREYLEFREICADYCDQEHESINNPMIAAG